MSSRQTGRLSAIFTSNSLVNKFCLKVFLNLPKNYSLGQEPQEISALLATHPSLCAGALKLDDIKASAEFLRQQNFPTAEILARPKCLLTNKTTMANRIKVLNECCFIDFKLIYLYRFVSILNKNISLLKAFNYVDREANIPEHLLKLLDIPVTLTTDISEDVPLSKTREIITNFYIKARLEMSNDELEKLWKIYGSRIKHRNLESIVKIINVLETKLYFSKQRIINNGFLLSASPDNLERFLTDVPDIGGVSMIEIIQQRPKIVMQSVQTITDIIKHVKSFNIPEERILKCLEVFTLGSETVKERLVAMSKIKEFNALITNPRILRLIHFQNKAKTRLDYLKQLKLNCISLNVLTGSSEPFEKYARDGVDRSKGRDAAMFLAKTFTKDRETMRDLLSRHPNSYHVPVVNIKAALDYLRSKKFTDEEIGENLYLLLYPVSRIDQKLGALLEWKAENNGSRLISGVSLSEIPNTKLLNLCLYYIEAEFHFTGDGIWDINRQNNKQDEVFPTTIPEFPKTLTKQHKYGTEPKKIQKILIE